MMRIEEITISDVQITIYVYGRLEGEYIQLLRTVCQKHLDNKRKVVMNVEGLNYVDMHGKNYLRDIRLKVELLGLPEFLKMELDN
jgi:anti-anti-sigma regulatory factor